MSKKENVVNTGSSPVDYAAIVASWSPEERSEREKKFVRKIDWRLLPILIIVYITNYIDRNAVPHARVQGLEKDLNMSGYQYNIVLSVTFVGYISMQELGLRLGIFYSAAMISGAFGGLFAAGIAAAFANNRLESWRWLFIIEGIATVVFAAITAFVIPDWPSTTKWLSPEERALGIMRIIEDAGEEEEEISTGAAFKLTVKDYRIWLCVIGQTCLQAVASLTNFLPTLVQNFGYNTHTHLDDMLAEV
ncbi:hypothetical protein KNSL1_003894 [Colletotrichum chrysophilum]|nr:hypothetical protein KNSL1_003894 [Colletotrichum chrysophilum]